MDYYPLSIKKSHYDVNRNGFFYAFYTLYICHIFLAYVLLFQNLNYLLIHFHILKVDNFLKEIFFCRMYKLNGVYALMYLFHKKFCQYPQVHIYLLNYYLLKYQVFYIQMINLWIYLFILVLKRYLLLLKADFQFLKLLKVSFYAL